MVKSTDEPKVKSPKMDNFKPRIRFTYFAAIAAYPKPGFLVPDSLMISQKYLQGQLFKETDTDRTQVGDLVNEFQAWIPFNVIESRLNEILGILDSNSRPSSYRLAYRDWTFKYQRGYAYYSFEEFASVDPSKPNRMKKTLRQEIIETISDSRGNPPQFDWAKDEFGVRRPPGFKAFDFDGFT